MDSRDQGSVITRNQSSANTDPNPGSLVMTALLIVFGVLAAFLRTYHLRTLYPAIDGISARQAIMALDITRGIHHFPFAPYLFEFDPTALAYIAAPILNLFGADWIVFQTIGAVTGVLGVLFWILVARRLFSMRTALFMGILIVSSAPMLCWDRVFIMSGGHLIHFLGGGALLLMASEGRLSLFRWAFSGVLGAVILYINIAGLIYVGSLFLAMGFGRHRWDGRPAGKVHWTALAVFGIAIIIGLMPLIVQVVHHPQFLQWRYNHFAGNDTGWQDIGRQFIRNLWTVPGDIFLSTRNVMYQPYEQRLFPGILIPFLVMGLARARRTLSPGLLRFLIAFLGTWYIGMSLLQPGIWRGPYNFLILPWLLMIAAAGLDTMVSGNARKLWLAGTMFLSIIVAIHQSSLFLRGSYRPPPFSKFLVDLQSDLAGQPAGQYFFSSLVPEANFYHFPFWYVVRSRLDRVSIVRREGDVWRIEPAGTEFEWQPSAGGESYFIMTAREAEESAADPDTCWGPPLKRLPLSSLMVATGRVSAPDFIRDSWGDSAVPSIPVSED